MQRDLRAAEGLIGLRSLAWSAMVLLVFAAGCSGDPSSSTTATVTTDDGSATSEPSSTTTETTVADPLSVTSEAVTSEAVSSEAVSSEPDCALGVDTLVVQPTGGGWAVGDGTRAVLDLPDADPALGAEVVGAVDLDDDTTALVVGLGGGAYTEQIGFVELRGCELHRVTFADGSPATFLYGASVANFTGVRCGDGFVEQYEFTVVDGAEAELRYAGGATRYQYDDGQLQAEPAGRTILTASELAAIPVFDCGR